MPITHTQSSPATTWTITHNLGRPPVCEVVVQYNGESQVILPKQVIHTSANEVQIVFSVARSGTARLI
jgi:hypothetical protein